MANLSPPASAAENELAAAQPAAEPAPLLAASLLALPWAIDPAALPWVIGTPAGAIRAAVGAPQAETHGPDARSGTVAVIRADGIVLPRCHPVYERLGWATSCESLPARIEAAIAEGASAVAVLFDSPGGSSAGVTEAARRIAAAARTAPVVAVADHLAASAAYHLAASCTAFVASPSALVGSVGVILVRLSLARMADADGVDVHALYRGEGKTDHYQLVEATEAALERMQGTVDAYYADFRDAVAAGRNVPRRTVENVWGARVLKAEPAHAAKMVDGVTTARDVIARLSTSRGRSAYRRLGATRAAARSIVTAIHRTKGGHRAA